MMLKRTVSVHLGTSRSPLGPASAELILLNRPAWSSPEEDPHRNFRLFIRRPMLSSTFLFVFSGCLLGALQLAVGIAVGLRIRRHQTDGGVRRRAEIRQAERIAQRLQSLADDMSSCVDEHRRQLENASRQLTAKNDQDDHSLADLVAGVISEVVGANQTLQSKLQLAETRLQEQAAEIEAQMSRAMTDALTGLPNRREFDERLAASMDAWTKRGEPFSLLMLDVDHFKKLNDQYGHVAGDLVLSEVGQALRGALRRADIVARYGGEEFAMLFPATSLDQAARLAQKVRQVIAVSEMEHEGKRFKVTVSGGVATIERKEEAATMVGRADAALYAAKQAGRNRIHVHDGDSCQPFEACDVVSSNAGRNASGQDESAQVAELLSMVETLVRTGRNEFSGADAEPNSLLSPEPISAQLSEACEELRRLMAERCGSKPLATATP
jgi:diguanylate cyclase (GGDEF)-like protein